MKAKNVDFALKQSPSAAESALPKGWEERFDPGTKRKFYIDHINKVRDFSSNDFQQGQVTIQKSLLLSFPQS